MKKVLKFHTKRGGRFNNSGYVIFVGFEDMNEGTTLESLFYDEDRALYHEPNGNEADLEINKDGTGYLDIDGEYDTIRCVLEDDLSESQATALSRITDQNVFIAQEEIREILNKYYPEYLSRDWK